METPEKTEHPQPNTSESSLNKLYIVAGVIISLLVVASLSIRLFQGDDRTPPTPPPPTPTPFPADKEISVNESALIYGQWSGDTALVKAYDVGADKTYLLARLPKNIKRITAHMPNTMYYLNKTDVNDHAKELVQYNFAADSISLVIPAEDGYGIDDYFVSQDGNFVTTWEVKLLPDAEVLFGGNSRVYGIDLRNPTQKYLLYDESASEEVHYPRAVTNTGMVLTDMFLPNSGPGWSYGMGTADITGQQQQSVASMQNGTYGRQPRTSPDGSELVFVGYDGSRGSGTELLAGVARRALVYPNTVEVLASDTLQRTKLNLPNTGIYDDARFDRTGDYVFVTHVPDVNQPREVDLLVYDLASNNAREIPNAENKRGLAMFPEGKVLAAVLNVSDQAMGNLGETYQYVSDSYEIIDLASGEVTPLAIADINTGYIGTFPIQSLDDSVKEEISDAYLTGQSLQLRNFELKPDLYDTRVRLQSINVNADLPAIPTIPENASEEEILDLIEQILELLESISIEESRSQN